MTDDRDGSDTKPRTNVRAAVAPDFVRPVLLGDGASSSRLLRSLRRAERVLARDPSLLRARVGTGGDDGFSRIVRLALGPCDIAVPLLAGWPLPGRPDHSPRELDAEDAARVIDALLALTVHGASTRAEADAAGTVLSALLAEERPDLSEEFRSERDGTVHMLLLVEQEDGLPSVFLLDGPDVPEADGSASWLPPPRLAHALPIRLLAIRNGRSWSLLPEPRTLDGLEIAAPDADAMEALRAVARHGAD